MTCCEYGKKVPYILSAILFLFLGYMLYIRSNETPEEKAERLNPIAIECINGYKFYRDKHKSFSDWKQFLDKDGKPVGCN